MALFDKEKAEIQAMLDANKNAEDIADFLVDIKNRGFYLIAVLELAGHDLYVEVGKIVIRKNYERLQSSIRLGAPLEFLSGLSISDLSDLRGYIDKNGTKEEFELVSKAILRFTQEAAKKAGCSSIDEYYKQLTGETRRLFGPDPNVEGTNVR